MRKEKANKALHGPPGGACHATFIDMILASQEARQSPGVRNLER